MNWNDRAYLPENFNSQILGMRSPILKDGQNQLVKFSVLKKNGILHKSPRTIRLTD